MRLLLVDDDARLRQAVKRMLEGQPFETMLEASDGEEALATLKTQPVDLIITDMQMPRMDGVSLVKALRAAGNATPVIMFSAQHDPHAIVTAIKAGVDNYVPKPIHPEILLEKIQQTLGATRKAA